MKEQKQAGEVWLIGGWEKQSGKENEKKPAHLFMMAGFIL